MGVTPASAAEGPTLGVSGCSWRFSQTGTRTRQILPTTQLPPPVLVGVGLSQVPFTISQTLPASPVLSRWPRGLKWWSKGMGLHSVGATRVRKCSYGLPLSLWPAPHVALPSVTLGRLGKYRDPWQVCAHAGGRVTKLEQLRDRRWASRWAGKEQVGQRQLSQGEGVQSHCDGAAVGEYGEASIVEVLTSPHQTMFNSAQWPDRQVTAARTSYQISASAGLLYGLRKAP